MLLSTDVAYDDARDTALAAGVAFRDWGDAVATAEHTVPVSGVHPYEPGAFYRRELHCLRALLDRAGPVEVVIIDGYVDPTPGHAGLGRHLYDALRRAVIVVGVAKRRFEGTAATAVLRGGSTAPLYVTAAGMSQDAAAARIAAMHGPHRIPTLLRRADRLSRGDQPG